MSKDYKNISATNVAISTGLLWLVYYSVVPNLVALIVGGTGYYDNSFNAYVIGTFIGFGLTALIAGIMCGKMIKRNEVKHSLIIGCATVFLVVVTMMPAKNIDLGGIGTWAVIVLVPIILGTYFGMWLKKRK